MKTLRVKSSTSAVQWNNHAAIAIASCEDTVPMVFQVQKVKIGGVGLSLSLAKEKVY